MNGYKYTVRNGVDLVVIAVYVPFDDLGNSIKDSVAHAFRGASISNRLVIEIEPMEPERE